MQALAHLHQLALPVAVAHQGQAHGEAVVTQAGHGREQLGETLGTGKAADGQQAVGLLEGGTAIHAAAQGQAVVDDVHLVFLSGGAEALEPGLVGHVVGTDEDGVAGFFGQDAVLRVDVARTAGEGEGDARQARGHPDGGGGPVAPGGMQKLDAVTLGLFGQQETGQEAPEVLGIGFQIAHLAEQAPAQQGLDGLAVALPGAPESLEQAQGRHGAETLDGPGVILHLVAATAQLLAVHGIDADIHAALDQLLDLAKDEGLGREGEPEQDIGHTGGQHRDLGWAGCWGRKKGRARCPASCCATD